MHTGPSRDAATDPVRDSVAMDASGREVLKIIAVLGLSWWLWRRLKAVFSFTAFAIVFGLFWFFQ